MQRDLMLGLGPSPTGPRPEPGDPEWEALRAIWKAYPDRHAEWDWGRLAFGPNADPEAAARANPLIPVE